MRQLLEGGDKSAEVNPLARTHAGNAFYIDSESAGLRGYYRVVFVSEPHNVVALYRLDVTGDKDDMPVAKWTHSAAMPIRYPLSLFLSLSEKECIQVNVRLPSTASRAVGTLAVDPRINKTRVRISKKAAESEKERFDRYQKLIEALVSPDQLTEAVLVKSFDSIAQTGAKEAGVCKAMALRYIARFFICECDAVKAAMTFVFGWDRTPTARKITKKLGRPFDYVRSGDRPKATGRNSDADDLAAVKGYEASLNKDERKWSISARHQKFIESVSPPVAQTLADGQVVYGKNKLGDITYSQYSGLLKKIASERQRLEQSVGKIRWRKDHRILTGTARDYVPYPGFCYIIDATVADIYLVSAVDRRRLIGRPTLYFVVDAFSSLIVSVHVALGPASMDEAQIALYRAVMPKGELLESLGLPPELLQFLPQGCVPRAIFADRGELLSERARELAEELRLQLVIAPPYRPDLKGLVERYFKFTNESAVHWMPGAVVEKIRERGQDDPRLDAALTISGLMRVLLLLIAENNGYKNMSEHASVPMIRNDINATPIDFWKYGLSELHGSPHFLAKSDAVKQFLPTLKARCNRLGIQWDKLRYTNTWMREDDGFYAESMTGAAHIFHDPDRPLKALYLDPETHDLRDVDLLQNRGYEEYQEDISFIDIVDTEARTAVTGKVFALDNKDAQNKLRQMRSKIVREETEATKVTNKGTYVPKSRRTKDIKGNRREEQLNAIGVSQDAKPTAAKDGRTSTIQKGDEKAYIDLVSSLFGV